VDADDPAQLWLVYDLTHSPAAAWDFGFANQIPMLVLASVGGYVGDATAGTVSDPHARQFRWCWHLFWLA